MKERTHERKNHEAHGLRALVIFLTALLLMTSCGSAGDTGTIAIRIGGDIPVGTVRTVVTAHSQNGDEYTTELQGSERTAEMEVRKGTYGITAAFIGSCGDPHVLRHEDGIEVRAGERRGVTVRLPEDIHQSSRLLPMLPNKEFREPSDEVIKELKEKNYTLTLWHGESGRSAAALETVTEVFNATNPYNIRVELIPQGSPDMLHMKTMASLMTEEYPDIVMDSVWRINEYVPSGRLIELTPYIDDGYGLTEEDYGTINPVIFRENSSYPEGAMYSTALSRSAEVLFYNKTFTDENSINIPHTLRELTEYSRKASKMIQKPAFGISSLRDMAITGPVSLGAAYTAGGNPDEFFTGVSVGRSYRFYEWWHTGVEKGWFRTKGDDESIRDPYRRKELIFFTAPSTDAVRLSSDTIRTSVTAMPAGDFPAVLIDGPSFAGFHSSEDDELRDLAISIVLEWFWSPEAGTIASSITGALPSNKAALEEATRLSTGLIKEVLEVLNGYTDSMLIYPPTTMESQKLIKALSIPIEGAETEPAKPIDVLMDDAIKAIDDID